jgi:uncharacterized DUF497 family protein
MRINFAGFDWDDANRKKCRKHGVSIDEIEALFADEPKTAPDPKHSVEEDRFLAVGRTRNGRPLFVAFTFRHRRDTRLIRPISARYMHKKEIEAYEAQDS